MKQRLGIYLLACLLVGLLFAAIEALLPHNNSTFISVRFYPASDADQIVDKINDLHLKNVTATKIVVDRDFLAFCLQAIAATVSVAVSTALVLVGYSRICRMLKITFKT